MTEPPGPLRPPGQLVLQRDVRNVAPLLAELCTAECYRAAMTQRVAMLVDLQPVFLPASHRIVLELACRSLLVEALGRSGGVSRDLRIGVQLWRTEPPAEEAARLVVASMLPAAGDGPPAQDGLVQARDAVEALGGAFTSEAQSVWRVTLPLPPLTTFEDTAGSPAPG